MLMFKMRIVHPSVCQSNPGNIIISAQQTAQFHAKSEGTDTQKFPCPLLTHFACHLLCNHVQIQLCFHHLFLGACNHQNKKQGISERKHVCIVHTQIHTVHVLISKQLGKLQTSLFFTFQLFSLHPELSLSFFHITLLHVLLQLLQERERVNHRERKRHDEAAANKSDLSLFPEAKGMSYKLFQNKMITQTGFRGTHREGTTYPTLRLSNPISYFLFSHLLLSPHLKTSPEAFYMNSKRMVQRETRAHYGIPGRRRHFNIFM